jgi:hypothetical protein
MEGVAGSTIELGDLALVEGDWNAAQRWYSEALADNTEVRSLMYLFAGIAAVAAATGRQREAALLWGAAEQVESELDQGIDEDQRERYQDLLGDLVVADVARGHELPRDEAVALARELVEAPIG